MVLSSSFPGTNEKTKKEGDFPLDSLYIIPTLSKPSKEILVAKHSLTIIVSIDIISRSRLLSLILKQEIMRQSQRKQGQRKMFTP